MISIMGNTLLRKLLTKIRGACWFSILADETRDISNQEHLLGGEDLVGLVHVPTTQSAILTAAIKDVLVRCILPLNNCRGQGYDGA
jgi:hypothetical protein